MKKLTREEILEKVTPRGMLYGKCSNIGHI